MDLGFLWPRFSQANIFFLTLIFKPKFSWTKNYSYQNCFGPKLFEPNLFLRIFFNFFFNKDCFVQYFFTNFFLEKPFCLNFLSDIFLDQIFLTEFCFDKKNFEKIFFTKICSGPKTILDLNFFGHKFIWGGGKIFDQNIFSQKFIRMAKSKPRPKP